VAICTYFDGVVIWYSSSSFNVSVHH
jgi:hypothetical protein